MTSQGLALGTPIDSSQIHELSVHAVDEKSDTNEDIETQFRRLYLAAIRDTSPPRIWLPLFIPLISENNMSASLLTCSRENDPRDILLQVRLAIAIWKQYNDQSMLEFLARRLSLIAHLSNPKWQRELSKALSLLSVKELSPMKYSVGALIIFGMSASVEINVTEIGKWIMDNFYILESLPIALLSLGKFLDKVAPEAFKELLVPVFHRLLLRSPSAALSCIMGMGSFKRSGQFLEFLGDAFTSQLISENDELREKSHKVLIRFGQTFDYLKAFNQAYPSKSIKVKRSLLTILYEIAKAGPRDQIDTTLLKSLLSKENNEELSYLMLCCLTLVDPQATISDLEKLSKQSARSAYLAALSIVRLGDAAVFTSMLSKKDLSSSESLCLGLILAESNLLKADWVKAGLRPLGFLSEKAVLEALLKFSLLPCHRLLSLMRYVLSDRECSIALWKSLLGSNQLRELVSYTSTISGPFSMESLAQACHDLAPQATHSQADALCKLICSCIRSRADTIAFHRLAFIRPFDEIALVPKMRRSKHFSDVSDLDNRLPAIFEAMMDKNSGPECIRALFDTFPEAIPYFGNYVLSHVRNVASTQLSSEDHQILNATEAELPIIDVLAPLRRAQELAARKDPSKKLAQSPLHTLNGGLTKQEKTALDAEVQRERAIKARLTGLKQLTSSLAERVNIIAEVRPQLLESVLGPISSYLKRLMSLDWILPENVKLLYALSRCCSLPIWRHGPLLITCFLTLSGAQQHIDREWCILNGKVCVSAVVKRLEAPPTSMATLLFISPILLLILRRAQDLELTESQAFAIFGALEVTATSDFDDPELLREFIVAVAAAVAYLPSILKASIHAINGLINTLCLSILKLDQNFIAEIISSGNQYIRQFGLEVIRGLVKKSSDFIVQDCLRPLILVLLSDEHCSSAAAALAETIHLTKDMVGLGPMRRLLIDDSLDEGFGITVVNSICELSGDAEFLSGAISDYKEQLSKRLPEMASVRSTGQDLTISSRKRISLLFKEMAINNKILEEDVCDVLKFYLTCGLYDECEEVRTNFLDSVSHMLDNVKSEETFNAAVGSCEALLSSKSSNHTEDSADRVRVYGVIVMSKLAERFSREDPRRSALLSSLFLLLSTPSECVQHAVADAMINLFATADMPVVSDYANRLLDGLIKGRSVAIRRGCAYGLGALCKGFGSRALKHFEILTKLVKVLQDKGENMELKQGALFGLELQAFYLGRSFEPYVILLLDCLLVTFADGRTEIKEATKDAADMMMRSVTSLGAQLILPILLSLLESNSWRSKVGALEWLGAMANLAPRVLTKQLPSILPRILDSLSDSHHAVQTASREALHRYVGVIKNPEIRALAPLIMDALANPPEFTEKCLDAVLHTAFAHVIDASSMALLEPVLVRALRDRGSGGTEVKRKSAQILGNLATSLIDPRDLVLFLHSIAPALVACLSDPVPEVRANCGKVLGILVEITNEDTTAMKTLVPDLLTMVSGPFATSVDRAGAAQALAEIFAARGPSEISDILGSQILESLSSDKGYVREGYAMLVGYLPSAFDVRGSLPELYGEGLQDVLAPVISLLADDVEAVREAATNSCHQIISRVSRIDRIAIFDVLMETLSDRRWRCRLGCLQLFQEFLSKFSSEESDAAMGIFATPSYEELIEGGIDADRINNLMAKAFLYRFDGNSSAIRHLSLTIWKGLASHPLRALSCILSLLLRECCVLLSKDTSHNEMVAKAMEDVLTKIGDRVIIAVLESLKALFEEGFEASCIFIASQSAHQFGSPSFPSITCAVSERVMTLFAELINSGLLSASETTRRQTCTLFKRVCDSNTRMMPQASVAEAIVGPMVEELTTDEVIDPVTLSAIVSLLKVDEEGNVLGLAQRHLFESWRNLTSPKQGETLCSITESIFDCLGARGAHISVQMLQVIVSSLYYSSINGEMITRTVRSLLSALEADADSPYQVSLSQLLENLYSEGRSTECFRIISIYCSVENAELSRFYNVWPLRICENIVENELARCAIASIIETVSPEHMVLFVGTLATGLGKIQELPFSCRPIVAAIVKHLVVPLLVASNLLAVEDEERRSLACRITVTLAQKSTLGAWSTSLTSLVGALIRTASDKKTTSLTVFDALVQCVMAQIDAVKPFYPQLQRIFLNGLGVEAVQQVSIAALSSLIPALSRPEQAISELLEIVQKECEAQIPALRVMKQVSVITDPVKYVEAARACMASDNPAVREAASQWVHMIATLPQMSQYESQLSSLLQLA